MLIATSNQVFTLEGETPTQCLAIDGIRCLDEGVRCSAIGLADGQVVVLADGQAQPQATGIGDSVECICPAVRRAAASAAGHRAAPRVLSQRRRRAGEPR